MLLWSQNVHSHKTLKLEYFRNNYHLLSTCTRESIVIRLILYFNNTERRYVVDSKTETCYFSIDLFITSSSKVAEVSIICDLLEPFISTEYLNGDGIILPYNMLFRNFFIKDKWRSTDLISVWLTLRNDILDISCKPIKYI